MSDTKSDTKSNTTLDEYVVQRNTFVQYVKTSLDKINQTIGKEHKIEYVQILFDYLRDHKWIWYNNLNFHNNNRFSEVVYIKLLEFREDKNVKKDTFNVDRYFYQIFDHHICQGRAKCKNRKCHNKLLKVKPQQKPLCHIHIKQYKKTINILTKKCGLCSDLSYSIMNYVSY